MKILITGSGVFIGSNLAKKLLTKKNIKFVEIDYINNYYDVGLKKNCVVLTKYDLKVVFY